MKLVTSLLFYLFSLTLGSLCLWRGIDGLEEGYRSSTWPCVDGVVERLGEVEHQTRRYMHGFEVTVYYSFAHNDKRYEGARITTDDLFYGSVFLLGWAGREWLRREYAPGTHVSVCYDPAHPEESALLRPGIHGGSIARTIFGVFFFVFAGVVSRVERRKSRVNQW
jgi:hypothetical protein